MTDDRIRVAIAQHLGWKRFDYVVCNGVRYNAETWVPPHFAEKFNPDRPFAGCAPGLNHMPDWPNDLNAMREAEKSLETNGKRHTYVRELGKLTLRNTTWFEVANNASEIGVIHSITPVVSATARQRCEAFLRTFGLWEE